MTHNSTLERQQASSLLTDADWAPSSGTTTIRPSSITDEEIFSAESPPGPFDTFTVTVTEITYRRMRDLVERIGNLSQLPLDWDSYGAARIQPPAVWQAVRLLSEIMANDVPPPSIVPTSDGGLQLEWHQEEADLEMDVRPDLRVDIFLKMPKDQTWEGPLANSRWRLQAFLQQIAERRSVV